MIISHEHKFIFLKTKKTAGTAIEAALSELCGPLDVITTLPRGKRAGPQGPRSPALSHPASLKPKRPLWRKLLMPSATITRRSAITSICRRASCAPYVGEEVWRNYFKFAFDRNPWDRQVSWYLYKTKSKRARPSFERFMASRRRAFVNNYSIYTQEGALAVDRLLRAPERGPQQGAQTGRRQTPHRSPAHQCHSEQRHRARLSELLLARDQGAGRGVVSAGNRAAGLHVLTMLIARPCAPLCRK